jgi:hypothetical protein
VVLTLVTGSRTRRLSLGLQTRLEVSFGLTYSTLLSHIGVCWLSICYDTTVRSLQSLSKAPAALYLRCWPASVLSFRRVVCCALLGESTRATSSGPTCLLYLRKLGCFQVSRPLNLFIDFVGLRRGTWTASKITLYILGKLTDNHSLTYATIIFQNNAVHHRLLHAPFPHHINSHPRHTQTL